MKIRLRYAVLVMFVGIVSCTTEPLQENLAPIAEAENNKQLEQELLELVNAHRIDLGAAPLEFSEIAYKYANAHNDYMIAKGSLSHDNFTSRASSIYEEVAAQMVAENVAKDYNTAQDTYKGWYNSANHKKTMEGEFTHTAVSVKLDSKGTYYYTQLFYRQ